MIVPEFLASISLPSSGECAWADVTHRVTPWGHTMSGTHQHHVKNSEHFARLIEDLEIPPGRTIISYDVSALFTSIPTEEALKVIKQRLEMDDTLEQRSELSIPQLMELMEMCLNTTYFVYKHKFY